MQPLENILKILEEDFEATVKMFKEEDWKFFKFGRGGPYYRYLTMLQKKSNEWDQEIFNYFGTNEETASFNKLVVVCLQHENPKEMYKLIDSFRRRIIRMRKKL